MEVLGTLLNEKVTGTDRIYNKHLKCAVALAPFWTALFNKRLLTGTFPAQCRDAALLVISEKKADPTTLLFGRKHRTKAALLLLTNKPNSCLESVEAALIPEIMSTKTSCKIFMTNAKKALATYHW